MKTENQKIIENMEVKLLVQRKKLNQALEQNNFMIQDLNKLKGVSNEQTN